MNMNLYGHHDAWLMVDCGVTFDEVLSANSDGAPRHDVVCADPSFIAHQKERLSGIVITHAHEDHIGALPYLWRRFKCPVYTTPYTAEILRRKLARENTSSNIPIVEVKTGDCVQIGPFSVTWMAITHSIPEPHALLINTPLGAVFHTADWKIDKAPVTDKAFNSQPFKLLRKQHVLAMVCDSTNALREGHSVSEKQCYLGLKQHIESAKGRVVVGCFSSNIARLITLAQVAKETGRYLSLLGRSLQNTVGAAKATGHWPDDLPMVDPYHTGYLLPEEVLAVATGSQGEPRAALSNLANDNYRLLSMDKQDLVIFSSIVIPGNEKSIEKLIGAFKARNIHVVTAQDSELPIHASGHPCQDELKQMYDWVRPQLAVPTHGEPQHLKENAKIARACHVPQALTGENGDIFTLSGTPKIITGAVKAGRIPLRS